MDTNNSNFTIKPTNPSKKKKKLIPIIIIIFIIAAAATSLVLFLILSPKDTNPISQAEPESEPAPTIFYDSLTGEEIVRSGTQSDGTYLSVADAEARANNINTAPTFCIQMPNGLDGARPHAGLNEAKVVFEAIAEAGITRFAAIFQDPTTNAIGPIRSLRSYYLSWDTPFDCTIIHAGGEDGALQEVSTGYRHLTESNVYMWRTTGHYVNGTYKGYFAPNNLFSDATLLKRFNADSGYTESHPKTWERLTPDETAAELAAIQAATQAATAEASAEEAEATAPAYTSATNIHVHYGSVPGFNPVYTYRPETNTYLRSYEDGSPHAYHICTTGSEPRPEEDCGEAKQVEAGVAIVIKVQESLSPINHYREVITTTGSGEAWIFQNGIVHTGFWHKNSNEDQITFTDANGETIKLAPGQTWISAIPASTGYVTFE